MQYFEPAACRIGAADGTLGEATGRYEKRLADLAGLYRDEAAFAALAGAEGGRVVYAVEEFRPTEAPGDLIFGVTRMEPGTVAGEFFMTRGHIHRRADRPEIYQGLSGKGLMLLESPAGETRIVALDPGVVCYVPPFWIHRSVNVGAEVFATFFCYPSDSGQDYGIIARSGGMRTRIHDDGAGGWTARDNDLYRPRAAEEVARLHDAAA